MGRFHILHKEAVIINTANNLSAIVDDILAHHSRSSKPTQAQGLCGLTHCYVDARTGALICQVIVKKAKFRYNSVYETFDKISWWEIEGDS